MARVLHRYGRVTESMDEVEVAGADDEPMALVTTGDPREVLVEIRGPAGETARVRAWIIGQSGSLTGDGVAVWDVADDEDVPGWSRCRMTVVPARE